MKSLTSLLNRAMRRNSNIIHQQMELNLHGSKLNKDEAQFLLELRRLREQLSRA